MGSTSPVPALSIEQEHSVGISISNPDKNKDTIQMMHKYLIIHPLCLKKLIIGSGHDNSICQYLLIDKTFINL